MAWLENVIFRDREMINERLELTDKNSLYYLSDNLVLRNCTVSLKVAARNLIIKQARFIDCTFDVKQELKNHQQWVFASIKGCRFKGKFSGCDFGTWTQYTEEAPPGSIEDCDFSEARLDACRFMGCDERTLRFPSWPCFTFLDPIGRAPELRAVPWPGCFGSMVIEKLHELPPETRAMTLFAPIEARYMETTPEALQAAISRFDCIVS